MLTESDERLVVLAATNRPQELDDAALRRFTKRIYVEMPDIHGRKSLLESLLKKTSSPLSNSELDKLAKITDGYSCSDITNLAKDAAMAPLREMTQVIRRWTDGHLCFWCGVSEIRIINKNFVVF